MVAKRNIIPLGHRDHAYLLGKTKGIEPITPEIIVRKNINLTDAAWVMPIFISESDFDLRKKWAFYSSCADI